MLAVSQAFALPDDAQQRSEIIADQNVFDFKTRTTTFYGNVIFQQGSLKINADKLIYYGKFDSDNPSSTDKIVATGKPARFQQTPRQKAEPVKAVANRLEYAVKAETLFLIDNASLDQDGSSLSGNRIEYDVKKAVVKASGKKNNKGEDGRVRMVIPPKLFQNEEQSEEEAGAERTPAAEGQAQNLSEGAEEVQNERKPQDEEKLDATPVAVTPEPQTKQQEP